MSLAERLREPVVGQVAHLSARHREFAQLVAMGVPKNQIAARFGMTAERIHQVTNSPACQELIAQYVATGEQTTINAVNLAAKIAQQNLLNAVLLQADVLAEISAESEKKPYAAKINQILEASADRVGFSRHHTQTNINIDLCEALDRAIRESTKAKTIVQVAQGSSPVAPAHEGDRVLCQRLLSPSTLSAGATGVREGEVRVESPPPFRRRA